MVIKIKVTLNFVVPSLQI